MYWSLANDLSAVASNTSGIGGRSLLRSSATYAYANTSLSSVYVLNGTLASPLTRGFQLTTALFGPYGSIDMVYVPPPVALQQLMSYLLDATRTSLAGNLAAQGAYFNITPLDLSRPVPSLWLTSRLVTFGGSPLCPEALSGGALTTAGLGTLVSYDGICLTSTGTVKVQPTRQQYILSAILAGLQMTDNMTAICALDPSFTAQCAVYLPRTLGYIQQYMQLPSSMAIDVANMHQRIAGMNISAMIYARTSTNTSLPLTLRVLNLLDDRERSFKFFAWLFFYDWVFGIREVISFQGDDGGLSLMSDLSTPLSQATQAWEVPANIAQYLRAGVLYVTGVMIAVAGLAFVYIMAGRGQFEGLNMLELGRVGGIVWVGRPFLLLRSMTAICVLSTATLQLQNSGYLSYFATVQDPWYKTFLAANEVTWLITIVNDIFLVFTGDYASYYVTPNGFVVWVFASAVTVASPVTPATTIDLHCRLEQVDLYAVCTAGDIAIGSSQRMLLLASAVLLSQVLSFATARLCIRVAPSNPVTSLFMSSGAKFLFVPGPWMDGDVYYVDRASAVLDGLLTWRLDAKRLVVLDVKSWRIFMIPVDTMHPISPAFAAAVPLINDV
ncbi:hypothetical protein SDRG_08056 [Saprolegnia diclina VS20]|uniref:Transmembrane protein n=1 Tax=Saprolegnia diclina (strain VS20) TaxID=1156394 RepID=T0RP92_SAPDV|nr:hypothetical protein SDRG_08056 [Saprolegnia diclina VS20]EQC34283.1 hypothetical protein SDRG_08056 [Saprolegnia diclina VS20]|eukprot:XP_008612145.1 hypothetical protein SDRG_08056 [Saprolegnia diclina VS20]